jgi:DNA modification methylase
VNGDCRLLVRGIPSGSVGCVITSPPYGDQKDYGSEGEMGAGSNEDFRRELKDLFAELHRVCREGAAFWLVVDSIKRKGRDLPLPWEAVSLAHDTGWDLQDSIVWDKGKNLPWSHIGHFRGVCEHVLLFSKGKLATFDIDGSRDLDHLSSYWVKYPERYHPAGKAPSDLWHFPIPVQGSWSSKAVRHLCPFPVGLVARMLTLTTIPGDIVLDPFAGSGSVLAVSSELDRHALGVELSRDYFDLYRESGAKHLVSAAQEELPNPTSAGRYSLGNLIPKLRANKVAKTLYAQLSRPDRLPQSVLDGIQAFIVEATIHSGKNPRTDVRVTAITSRAEHIERITSAARDVIRIAPLSKFGVEIDFRALELTRHNITTLLPTSAGKSWYEYSAGRFNIYRRAFDRDEANAFLHLLPTDRSSRIPPILSNLNLRVQPATAD